MKGKMKSYYLYILSNKKRGTLYIDITDDLIKGVYEFKNRLPGIFEKNNVKVLLVYYEKIENVYSAIKEKKKLEKWDNIWKVILIEKFNPEWKDLYHESTSTNPQTLRSRGFGIRK